MITISWPAAIIILMGIYWPVTLSLAVAFIVVIFACTNKVTWRIVGVILAVICMVPAIWLFWISLTFQQL